MVMETTETLKENIEDYIETKVDLVKLKTANKTGSIISGLILIVALINISFFLI